MVHWTEMRKELRAAIGKFAGLQPDVMQGIDKMQNAAVVTGHLDAKTHELIALAVAVTTRCDGCLSVHVSCCKTGGDARRNRRGFRCGNHTERWRCVGLFQPRTGRLR